ncbi:MAG TPA: AMP-binding protein [Thermoanaerobaculia bacterium]|nr:AMP-binding protein [Thermoanaerobaculia bacterium]
MSWLARQARERPGTAAVRAGGEALTYAELAERAGRGAAALAAAGVAAGDRVAIRLPNTLEHAVAIHAVAWGGAVLVALHPRLAPGEAAALLAASGARLLIAAGDDPLAAAGSPCPVLPVERLGEGAGGPLAAPAPRPAPRPAAQPDRALHSILFTSGTTGRPRPVPLTCGNHRASAEASAANLGVRPDDDWLCPLPLAHVGGLAVVLRAVLYGTCVTLVEGFEPEAVARRLRSGAVTHASLVPTMLRRLLAPPPAPGGDELRPYMAGVGSRGQDTPLGSERLRAVLLGGGPVDPELVERALARGLPVLGTYGMTGTASQVATVPPASAGGKPGAAGPPLPGVEIELRDAGGRALPPGETGEIHVRGPMVSAALAQPDGWLATGDLGRLDGDGWLWIEGRREGVVVTGGENVSAAEVEAVLRAHPAVADCAVVGLPDPDWGELVAAAVVPRGPEAPPAAEALAAWCRARLAPFKVPKRWRIVEELPRTPSGKVARAEVRGLFMGH